MSIYIFSLDYIINHIDDQYIPNFLIPFSTNLFDFYI